jgi:poly-gamma-glutamate capsule biosynthesis protein CapA/YwtB (metallophosphatase superfamily)
MSARLQAAGTAAGADGPPGIRLFLCGDVMTGRGIDQVLPHPVEPHLFESWARTAAAYVELAERVAGPIGRKLDFAYPWGDALAVLQELGPDVRIVNLETAVTTSEAAQAGKGIHYRMNPANLPCLTSAGIDCCILANNHVLDWGQEGLMQTLVSLHDAGLRTAGAGRDAQEAAAPAEIGLRPQGRLLVFACAAADSGVPVEWAATEHSAGVNFLDRVSARTAVPIAERMTRHRQPGDIVVVSVHWGGNWGFDISREQRAFAHRLIDDGGADVVHGHSSHHVKGIEVYRGKLILYGCGDFLNDYEGIGGLERFRSDLALMYFPLLDPASGDLRELRAVPMRIRRFRLERADAEGASWLRRTLEREGAALGTRVETDEQGMLSLCWQTADGETAVGASKTA